MSGLQSALLGGGGGIKYWVSGTTYNQGDNARSPTDHQLYVRIVAGAGTTDPASDTTNWRPDGARAIKSIQTGVATPSGTFGASTTVTITAVDVNKSICLSSCQSGRAIDGNSYSYAINASCGLTGPTQLTITQSNSSVGSIQTTGSVRWTVVEYY